MIRRWAARTTLKVASRERRPAPHRAWRFILITLGSGAVAALLAIAIAGVPTVLSLTFPSPGAEIPASAVFPRSDVVHRVVTVYDPPPAPPRATSEPNEPGDD